MRSEILNVIGRLPCEQSSRHRVTLIRVIRCRGYVTNLTRQKNVILIRSVLRVRKKPPMQCDSGILVKGVDTAIDADLVRSHVTHLINSPEFVGAPRLTRFLVFVVETSLAGQGDLIKESLIAIEVYGRRPDYNPQIDSTVRVEAGRLRTRLRQYYEGSGRTQPVEIALPKGAYVPAFRVRPVEDPVLAPGSLDIGTPKPDDAVEPIAPAPLATQPGRRLSAIGALLFAACCLWATTYWRNATNPPAVQQERASGSAAALPVRNHLPSRLPVSNADVDPTALETFLRAHELLRKPVYKDGVPAAVPQSVLESIRLFEEVTRRSPRFAKAWVGLAEANEWAYELDRLRAPDRLSKARAAVRRAIEIEPNLPEAWTMLTSILFFREWDLPGAESAARRAIELNPRDASAQQRYADLLRVQGRVDEAASAIAHAVGLQPAAANLRARKALMLYESRKWEQALKEAESAEAINVSKQMTAYTVSLWIQGLSHERLGHMTRAEQVYRKALAHEPHDAWNEPALASLLARTGRREEAERLLEDLRGHLALGRMQHKALAVVHLALGRRDEALAALERGFRDRDPGVLFAGLDPQFDPIRDEPRFKALQARIRRASSNDS
jgi:tetratricopeptide (TPR) repeat protein